MAEDEIRALAPEDGHGPKCLKGMLEDDEGAKHPCTCGAKKPPTRGQLFTALNEVAELIGDCEEWAITEDPQVVVSMVKDYMAGVALATQAPAVAHSQAALDVLAERQRQISAEGWTPEHDDQHADGSLALAAGCYALHHDDPGLKGAPAWWPWHASWWKPKDSYRNLVKAGALIVAELERLRRASEPVQGSGS